MVGSTNVDLVLTVPTLPRPGDTVLGTTSRREAGGKGANQAAALARLGASVALVSAVGDDEPGRWSLGELTDRGVDVSRICVVDRPTGAAVVMVDAAGENAIVVTPGANALVQSPESITSDVLVLSLEVPLDVVISAARVAAAAGTAVVLNAAPARKLPRALLADVAVLVVNEGELAALGGDPAALCDLGPEAVVVTLGAKGCRIVTKARSELLEAVSVPVVDTTGAGDCFTAALAFGVASGWDISRSAHLATAAAGRCVTAVGARGGHPTLPEALALLD
ncbi:MAG: ribokinase [Mycobacteriales bacterium]